MRNPHVSIACLAACLSLLGCRGSGRGAAPGAKSAPAKDGIALTDVSDAAFASQVHTLLRDGKPTPARLSLLAGTVARAMTHANERFAAHREERGFTSLVGAMYLVRAGEFHVEMIAARADALASALAVVAPQGDEGRSMALLGLRKTILPAGSPERRDAESHLTALDGWMRDTLHGSSLEVMGSQERIEVARLLLEPTNEAMSAARDATIRFIDRALKFNEERGAAYGRPKREEAIEAFRAFRSGAETLAALYLRSGDAAGALAELEQPSIRKITPPALYERLQTAASGGDAKAYRDLLAWLWNPDRRDDDSQAGPSEAQSDPELAVDPGLLKAALWGTAIEAYRRDPTMVDVNMMLATLLVQLGLPEAAPLVLADAVLKKPDPAALSGSLGFVLQDILREDEADDAATARRVFAAAEPLLLAASRPEWKGRARPQRRPRPHGHGHHRDARRESCRSAPAARGCSRPGALGGRPGHPGIDRSPGGKARCSARQSGPRGRHRRCPAQHRWRAKPICMRSKSSASSARRTRRAWSSRARSSSRSICARALPIHRPKRTWSASWRACSIASPTPRARHAPPSAPIEASGNDKHELAATVLDATARAFLRHDDVAAKKAVSRGLSAELGDDDLVYAALWLSLLHRELKVKSDGSAAKALATVRDDGRWSGRLASWGLGKLKDQDLLAAARTLSQKTEATFYVALAQRAAGDMAGATAALKQVSQSPAIDLVEVQLARDLLAGPARYLGGPTPVTAPLSGSYSCGLRPSSLAER